MIRYACANYMKYICKSIPLEKGYNKIHKNYMPISEQRDNKFVKISLFNSPSPNVLTKQNWFGIIYRIPNMNWMGQHGCFHININIYKKHDPKVQLMNIKILSY